jgi:hypothetical protein
MDPNNTYLNFTRDGVLYSIKKCKVYLVRNPEMMVSISNYDHDNDQLKCIIVDENDPESRETKNIDFKDVVFTEDDYFNYEFFYPYKGNRISLQKNQQLVDKNESVEIIYYKKNLRKFVCKTNEGIQKEYEPTDFVQYQNEIKKFLKKQFPKVNFSYNGKNIPALIFDNCLYTKAKINGKYEEGKILGVNDKNQIIFKYNEVETTVELDHLENSNQIKESAINAYNLKNKKTQESCSTTSSMDDEKQSCSTTSSMDDEKQSCSTTSSFEENNSLKEEKNRERLIKEAELIVKKAELIVKEAELNLQKAELDLQKIKLESLL